MSSITEGNARQYGDSRKLAARARLHTEYTIAETGWFPWVAAQLPLKPADRVLDIGRGPDGSGLQRRICCRRICT